MSSSATGQFARIGADGPRRSAHEAAPVPDGALAHVRERTEADIAAPVGLGVHEVESVQRPHQRTVFPLDALGQPGRARCVADGEQVVGLHRLPGTLEGEVRRCRQILERRCAVEGDHVRHAVLDIVQASDEVTLDDQHPWVAVLQDVLDRGGRRRHVQHHRGGAQMQRGDLADRQLRGVAREQRDAIAVAHAETRQRAGGSLDGLRVLRPRQASSRPWCAARRDRVRARRRPGRRPRSSAAPRAARRWQLARWVCCELL